MSVSHHHTADVCQDEASLADTVADFFATGYYLAEPAILITTPSRRDAILARLSAMGISWERLEASGDALFCDGRALLGRFMVDGMPDEQAFVRVMSEILVERRRERSNRIRCFGDMVDVLCGEDGAAAAVRLEELWNALARNHAFTLLCGYIKGNLYREVNGGHYDRIRREHAAVRTVTPRSYVSLTLPEAQGPRSADLA